MSPAPASRHLHFFVDVCACFSGMSAAPSSPVVGVGPTVPRSLTRRPCAAAYTRASSTLKVNGTAAARVGRHRRHRFHHRAPATTTTARVPKIISTAATAAAAAADSPEGKGVGRPPPPVPRVTRPPPPAHAVEVIVRYTYPGVRFSQGRVAVVHVSPSPSPSPSSGVTSADSNLMTWREALADVNEEEGDDDDQCDDSVDSATEATMSWRDALAEVNKEADENDGAGDEEGGDDYKSPSSSDEDDAAAAAVDESSAHATPAPAADATITGAQVMAALAEDGVDTQRWRARVALTMTQASTRQHFNPEGAAMAAVADAADDEKSTSQSPLFRKPIYFNHVGWRRLSDDDVITFDPGATGLLAGKGGACGGGNIGKKGGLSNDDFHLRTAVVHPVTLHKQVFLIIN